jgi:hypothetical protein
MEDNPGNQQANSIEEFETLSKELREFLELVATEEDDRALRNALEAHNRQV